MKQPPKILMHLCFALIVLLIVLLAGFGAKNQQQCQAFSVLTHYFVLASFFWMGVEGVNIYLCVVKVMNGKISKFVWKASAVAWGKSLYVTFYCVFGFLLINQTDKLDNYHSGDWIFPS